MDKVYEVFEATKLNCYFTKCVNRASLRNAYFHNLSQSSWETPDFRFGLSICILAIKIKTFWYQILFQLMVLINFFWWCWWSKNVSNHGLQGLIHLKFLKSKVWSFDEKLLIIKINYRKNLFLNSLTQIRFDFTKGHQNWKQLKYFSCTS